jgi:hypothetical protein
LGLLSAGRSREQRGGADSGQQHGTAGVRAEPGRNGRKSNRHKAIQASIHPLQG